jgi:hypothetical protein
MMRVDMQITLRHHNQVEPAVPREGGQHMVEEPHASLDPR